MFSFPRVGSSPLLSDLSHQHNNISNDFTGHFLSHLSASARRQAANRLDSLWTLASNAERDKQAHLSRMKREIEEEAFKRRVHMQLLEEQAIERTLKKTMVDKAQERGKRRDMHERTRSWQARREEKRRVWARWSGILRACSRSAHLRPIRLVCLPSSLLTRPHRTGEVDQGEVSSRV